jgi:uncharacterized protein (DUF2235 family)
MAEGRNLVLCLDGTANTFSEVNTNVVHLFRAIERDGAAQRAYYDPGVGTFSTLALQSPALKWLGQTLGAAFGYGVTKNVLDAYRYLMAEYREGDRVFLFGFSRGAYTARALAGMLHHVGLLHAGSDNLVPYALRKYLRRKKAPQVARDFRAAFARPCPVHMLGVWDTVGALGALLALQRPFDTALNPEIRNACHAVALHERRRKFAPGLLDRERVEQDPAVAEVWFPGVHSDVGGGYPERGLSDLALRWMLDQAEAQGLRIRPGEKERIQGDPTGKRHESFTLKWWLLGRHVRTVPEGAAVHASVPRRMEAIADYRPANLPACYEVVG